MILPGSTYTIRQGDTLKTIAARAYGDESLWTRIAQANVPSQGKQFIFDPTIFPVGDIIIIPRISERKKISSIIGSEDRDETVMSIDAAGFPIEILRAKIYTSVDTVSDSLEVEYVWNPGENTKLDGATRPYSYSDISGRIGKTRLFGGMLFDVNAQFSGQGRIKTLTAFSYAKNAVDSDVIAPFQYNDVTLEEILKIQLERFFISVFIDEPVPEKFDRVTANKGEKIFKFLTKLTIQRGVLITSTPEGDIRVLKVKTSGSIGVIEEGKTQIVQDGGWQSVFSGQKRFRYYTAFGSSPAIGEEGITLVDTSITAPRFMSFKAENATEGNIDQILDWKRSKTSGDSMTFRLPVIGWYGPDNKLWRKNTILTLKSETMFIPDGYDLLIAGVEYSYTTAGKTAVLHLKPPQTYTKEKIPEPWL
jgi:prophage tail gpP-like protein